MIFAGTPAFAAGILEFLLKNHWPIRAVYTQPDRPAGRGLKMHISAVKEVAEAFSLPVFQPETLKTLEAENMFRDLKPKIFIVAAYGLILPQTILDIPIHGCINVHASLLPRWRGAAPITRALLAGDTETGVALMQMEAGLDTGPVIATAKCAIATNDTTQTLEQKLTHLGGILLHEYLPKILDNAIKALPQSAIGITYAHKIKKEEARLDLNESAILLERKVRAFFPWPIAFIQCAQGAYRIYEATHKTSPHHAKPGTVLSVEHALELATGDGILSIKKIQVPGSKPLAATEFLRGKGRHLKPGYILNWSLT